MSIHNVYTFIVKHALKLSLIFLFGIYVVAGISHLGKFQTADEDLWLANPNEGRVHEYWRAWKNKDWEETRINDKPGVTTAILSGLTGYKMDVDPEQKTFINGSIIDKFNPEYFEKTTFYFQLGVMLGSGLVVFFIAWFSWVITESRLFAFMVSAFLWISPILIGISQIVNPDATLWSFGTAAALGFVAFLVRGSFRYVFFAGIFLGLALLSKYTAAFLFFVMFFSLLASFLYETDIVKKHPKILRRLVFSRILGYGIFIIVALIVFALLMPASIIEPKYLYEGTFDFKGARGIEEVLWLMGSLMTVLLIDALLFSSRILSFCLRHLLWLRRVIVIIIGIILLSGALFTLFNWGFDNYFEVETAPFDAGKEKDYRRISSDWDKIALQIKPIVFTLTPLVLFLALLTFFLVPFLPNKYLPGKTNRNTSLLILLTFGVFIIAFYYAALEQRVLVHVRYAILLYPIASIIAAIGATILIHILYQRKKMLAYLLTGAFFLMSIGSLIADYPFYFNYTNDLLPHDQDVVGAWGYGGYEAAQFLNSLPYAQYSMVWADYEGFCPFFVGRCVRGNTIKWYENGTFRGLDYYVVSRRGMIRNESTWKKMFTLDLIDTEPIWTLYIGDRPGNYVEIYRAKSHYYETDDLK